MQYKIVFFSRRKEKNVTTQPRGCRGPQPPTFNPHRRPVRREGPKRPENLPLGWFSAEAGPEGPDQKISGGSVDDQMKFYYEAVG